MSEKKPQPDATLAEAKRLLESPDLLDRMERLIEQRGLRGEEMNRRLVFLAGVGGHLGDPIHLIVKGESSAGKQVLITRSLEPLPPKRIMRVAGLSEQALAYHEGPIEGVLFIEEAEGQQHAEYSLRVAMSDGRVCRLTVNKSGGRNQQEKLEVEVTASIITTTTKASLHPENQTRVFDVWVDDSEEQTRRVIESIALEAERDGSGLDETEAELEVLREALRLLEPLEITVPFAGQLGSAFPKQMVRARRDFQRMLALIRVCALLHQRQRARTPTGRVIATIQDYSLVYPVIQKVLEPSMSGLTEKALVLHVLHEELAADSEEGWVFRSDLEREAHRLGVLSKNRVHNWAREFSTRGIWEGVMEGGRWKHRTIRDPREEPIQLPRPEDLEDLPGTPKSVAGTSNVLLVNELEQPPSHDLGSSQAQPPTERFARSDWEVPVTRCDTGENGSQRPNWDALGGKANGTHECAWCGEFKLSCGFCQSESRAKDFPNRDSKETKHEAVLS